jgi:hypothetical protein
VGVEGDDLGSGDGLAEAGIAGATEGWADAVAALARVREDNESHRSSGLVVHAERPRPNRLIGILDGCMRHQKLYDESDRPGPLRRMFSLALAAGNRNPAWVSQKFC